MELIKNDHEGIVGWGVDADKNVRPNYPMWKPLEKNGSHWSVPEQQPGFNDFYSNERPGPTRVFGNTVQPKGLSGFIRKKAFGFSEGTFEHWMLLLLADRINVFEGLAEDVMRGYRPRLLEERGWNVDKKFKTKRYKKVMLLSILAVIVPIVALGISKSKRTQ